jgi:purine-binding chemotaxis protein CheW
MTGIDWHAIHTRLRNAQNALAQRASPGAEEAKRILRARARALAGEANAQHEPQDAIEVIEFLVAEETYAIETPYLREVYPLKELTPLPGTPPFVLGVVNIRGQIYSVIDIKRFFDLPDKSLTDLNKLVVIGDAAMSFGVLADRIVGTRRILRSELQASLPTLTGIREQYLKGVTGDRLVVLDAERLLSDPRIVVREQVET